MTPWRFGEGGGRRDRNGWGWGCAGERWQETPTERREDLEVGKATETLRLMGVRQESSCERRTWTRGDAERRETHSGGSGDAAPEGREEE